MQKELNAQKEERNLITRKEQMKKEEEILNNLILGENKIKDRHLIQEVLGVRHEDEKLKMMRENYDLTQERLREGLTKAWNKLDLAKREINQALEQNEISNDEATRKLNSLVEIDEMQIRLYVRKKLKKELAKKEQKLKKRHLNEIKQAFQKFYPGEEFEEEDELQINPDALNADIEARKRNQAKAYEKAKLKLDQETQAMKEQLEAEKEHRLAEITAEKEAQLLQEQELERQRIKELIKHKERQAKKN